MLKRIAVCLFLLLAPSTAFAQCASASKYWLVTDSSPTTQVWSGDAGAFVVLANATYVSWLALGCTPATISTATGLYALLNQLSAAAWLGNAGYTQVNINGTNTLTNPTTQLIFGNWNGSAGTVVMPPQNRVNSVPLGQPITIYCGSSCSGLVVYAQDGSTQIGSKITLGNDAITITPVDNSTANGTWYVINYKMNQLAAGIATSAQIYVGQGASDSVWLTMAGDATLDNSANLTIGANKITLAKLATQAANTALINATSGAAVPTAFAMPSCSTSASALNYTTNTGVGCNTSINAATLGGATFAAPGAIGGGTAAAGTFTSLAYSTTLTGTSTNSAALAVGRQGATTPAFSVDASTGSQTGGLKVTGSALNGTVAVAVTDTSGNTNLSINALGSGTITLGSVSTGAIIHTQATTLSAALTYGGVALSNSVTGTGSMVLSAGPTFTGTVLVSAGKLQSGANNTSMAAGDVSANRGDTTGYIFFGAAGAYAGYNGTTVQLNPLANVATTSAVCWGTGTTSLTYDGTLGTCTVSDERLKNMGPRIENALEKLLKINGVYYTWKDPSFGRGQKIGLGAQTVEKVFPELVETDSEGKMNLDYQRLAAPIIEAIRELNAKVEQLERRAK